MPASGIQPPQGFSPEQKISLTSRPLTVLIEPPQGEFGDDTPATSAMLFNNSLELMLFNNTLKIMDFN